MHCSSFTLSLHLYEVRLVCVDATEDGEPYLFIGFLLRGGRFGLARRIVCTHLKVQRTFVGGNIAK